MNPKSLQNQALNMFGNTWRSQRTGLKFKALSNGDNSNMIRTQLNIDVQLGDIVLEDQGPSVPAAQYFCTDLQQDNAAKYISIFPVTHALTNSTTGETLTAHLGSHTPAGPTDQAGFSSTPATFTFWIPATFSLSIGDHYTTAQGTNLRVARVIPTDNNGLRVIMNA